MNSRLVLVGVFALFVATAITAVYLMRPQRDAAVTAEAIIAHPRFRGCVDKANPEPVKDARCLETVKRELRP